MPTITGELHRSQVRFSPVNFTEYPRFLMPANKPDTKRLKMAARSRRERRRRRSHIQFIAPYDNFPGFVRRVCWSEAVAVH